MKWLRRRSRDDLESRAQVSERESERWLGIKLGDDELNGCVGGLVECAVQKQ